MQSTQVCSHFFILAHSYFMENKALAKYLNGFVWYCLLSHMSNVVNLAGTEIDLPGFRVK